MIPSIPTHSNTSTPSNQDHLYGYTSVPNNQNNNNNNNIISTNHSLLTSTSYITCNPIQNLNLYLHKHVYLCIYLCKIEVLRKLETISIMAAQTNSV